MQICYHSSLELISGHLALLATAVKQQAGDGENTFFRTKGEFLCTLAWKMNLRADHFLPPHTCSRALAFPVDLIPFQMQK